MTGSSAQRIGMRERMAGNDAMDSDKVRVGPERMAKDGEAQDEVSRHGEKMMEAEAGLPSMAMGAGDGRPSSPATSSTTGTMQPSRSKILLSLIRMLTWTPKRCRWDPDNPPKFSMALNFLYAFAACFTVANLYYNQPVLNRMAETFHVSFEKASSVATLLQSGYAAGLLFLCPLGDVVKRRPFILWLIWFTAMVWLGLCLTNNFALFSALSFICGATTVTPQLMLPLVGDYAPPHRKGSSLSIVVSGLMLGMLVARLLSGIISDATSWRGVYWFGLGVQYLILVALWMFMPDYPSTNPKGMNYIRVLWSIVRMLFTEPLLLQACLIAIFISAVFTSFWTTLTFLLASPPYEYSSLTIGLFSLIGIVAIAGGPVYGRLVTDRFVPWFSSLLGQLITLVGVAVGTATGTFTVAGPVIQAIAIDMGLQTAQTANRAAIYTINERARNRVNTAYMVSAFVGQLSGTAIGNRLYAEGGWRWSGSCGILSMVLCLVVCFARGPHERGWLGWSGGWGLRMKHRKDSSDEESSGRDGAGNDLEGTRSEELGKQT